MPAKIKSARNCLQMLPDSQNLQSFSSAEDSQHTAFVYMLEINVFLRIHFKDLHIYGN